MSHKKKRTSRLQHRVEYGLLRGVETLIGLLPETVALGFGVFLANVLVIAGFRRKETARRIREVFGEIPRREVRRIARTSLRNMVLNVIELMRLKRINAPWIKTHVLGFDDTLAKLNALRQQHGGLVLVLPHMGNWDLAGVVCERMGVNMLAIAAKQKNPFINNWLALRRGEGIRMIERGGIDSTRNALQLLREGYVLALLGDVRITKHGVLVDFLGKQACVGRGSAVFSACANVPIVPAVCERVGWRHHRFQLFDLLPAPDHPDNKEAAVQQQTQRVLTFFESHIRRMPEQWLWYNKRWVLTPVKPQGVVSSRC